LFDIKLRRPYDYRCFTKLHTISKPWEQVLKAVCPVVLTEIFCVSFSFFFFKTFMESFSYLLLFLVSYFFSYSLVDYNDMFIYLVGLFYIGKYLMFSFVACFSKLYCLFVIVQTLYVLNFDSSIIATMSGDN
jgi:hypothetical protein